MIPLEWITYLMASLDFWNIGIDIGNWNLIYYMVELCDTGRASLLKQDNPIEKEALIQRLWFMRDPMVQWSKFVWTNAEDSCIITKPNYISKVASLTWSCTLRGEGLIRSISFGHLKCLTNYRIDLRDVYIFISVHDKFTIWLYYY